MAAIILFVAKPGSHPTLHDWLDGIERPVPEERVKKGRGFQTHRYRSLTVNGLDIEIINTSGNVTCRNSFVTDLAVDRSNVAGLAACGRANIKSLRREGENRRACRVRACPLEDRERDLQRAQEQRLPSRAQLRPRQGEPVSLARHLEPLCLRLPRIVRKPRNRWEKARDILGSRQRFFEHLRTITSYLVFPSWSALVRTLRTGQPPPARASP